MSGLKIAEGFSLPLEFVTSTQAILARKRSGKSYTASVEAEELLAAGQQIAVIDPTSAWYGLRSSADGNGSGYPIAVFGGEHADSSLDFRSGKAMARALVEHGFSAIFDIGDWITDEQILFVFEFSSELLRINKSAIHLFLDEADTFAPQLLESKEHKKCLGATSRLVKQGGIKGIGVTMITQRGADLNKKVLSQIDSLTVLRMSHPPDIKPVTEWISANMNPAYADEVSKALPRLVVGDAFICDGPKGKGELVHIRTRRTFNSGATPKPGERRIEPKVLAKIDIAKLGAEIAASVERAKANDPQELQKRIRQLEAQIARPVVPTVDAEEVKVLKDTIAQLQEDASKLEQDFADSQARIKEAGELARKLAEVLLSEEPVKRYPESKVIFTLPLRLNQPPIRPTVASSSAGMPNTALRAGARRMLEVLVQWAPSGRTEAQVAAQVGMKRTGGTWGAYKSDLKNGGYIAIEGAMWFATAIGKEFVGADVAPSPTTTREVVDLWAGKLRKGAREMLDVLVSKRGHAISREELGEAVGMTGSGGTFGAYLSDLKQAGLIGTDRGRVWANRETLFL